MLAKGENNLHHKDAFFRIPRVFLFFLLFSVLLLVPVVWARADLLVSGVFYDPMRGFFWADTPLLSALHLVAYDGARVLGIAFILLASISFYLRRKRSVTATEGWLLPKTWVFLLLALVVAPGLIANVALKDHWGRARPREIVEFGGKAEFSPALVPHFEKAHANGSFVSGDGAFGFFLPAFAYVAPRRSACRFFWGGLLAGCVFGAVRIMMGAHFFSDVVYAAFTMLAGVAWVHAALYGRQETLDRWRLWFGRKDSA